MDNIYMEMPNFGGMVVGVYVRGIDVPNDPDNAQWAAYQAFLNSGGKPLVFDPAVQWQGSAWVRNDAVEQDIRNAATSDALLKIDQFHAGIVQQLVGNPTQTEKDTWPVKLDIAERITTNRPLTDPDRAFLNAAGIIDSVAQQAWAASVQKRAATYAGVVGIAEKLRNEARVAVKAATSQQQIAGMLADAREKATQAVAGMTSPQEAAI